MSLRGRFVAYLVFVHLVFAAGSAALLWTHPAWLLALEAFFVGSLVVGLRLLRRLHEPIEMIRTSADLIRNQDFTTRLHETGQDDLDPLVRTYNQMAERLRQERIHSEEQEHFLQRIIAGSPSGVVTLDLDDRISMVNPAAAALVNRPAAQLLGRRLAELGSPLADQVSALETDETCLVSLQGRRRIRARALHFMDRGFARRFIILDELTEELRRSEKAAYEKLIRMVSHEINNTAGAVGSLLQSCLAYGEKLNESDRREFVEAIGVAIARTGRMNEFVQGFADLVRLPTPRKRPADIRSLMEDVARLFQEDCARRRIRWGWDTSGELPPVGVDQAQIEQVLINVVKNAVEAIGEDGTITVRTGVDRSRPFLEITDDGGGIPPEVREHLFTPFFTSKKAGQGIGLTMAREILLGHGFDFSLESRSRGRTSFGVLF